MDEICEDCGDYADDCACVAICFECEDTALECTCEGGPYV